MKFSFDKLYVSLISYIRKDGCVGRRPPNPLLFKFANQRTLAETGRRLREMLLGQDVKELHYITGVQYRQNFFLFFTFLCILTFDINGSEPGDFHDASCGNKKMIIGLDLAARLIKDCRPHLP